MEHRGPTETEASNFSRECEASPDLHPLPTRNRAWKLCQLLASTCPHWTKLWTDVMWGNSTITGSNYVVWTAPKHVCTWTVCRCFGGGWLDSTVSYVGTTTQNWSDTLKGKPEAKERWFDVFRTELDAIVPKQHLVVHKPRHPVIQPSRLEARRTKRRFFLHSLAR